METVERTASHRKPSCMELGSDMCNSDVCVFPKKQLPHSFLKPSRKECPRLIMVPSLPSVRWVPAFLIIHVIPSL